LGRAFDPTGPDVALAISKENFRKQLNGMVEPIAKWKSLVKTSRQGDKKPT